MLTSAASSELWRLNCKMFAKVFKDFSVCQKKIKKHSFPLFQHSIGSQPGCVSHIWRHPITDNTHRCLTQQTNVSGCPVSSASLTRRKSNAIVNQPQPRFTWTTDFKMIILTHEPETPIQSDTMQSILASRSTNVHSAPAFRVKWGGKCRQSISAPSGSINIETWPTRGALRMEVNSPHTEHKTS